MNTTRQDAWTQDEDTMLAETVLRYIREGKTQLEAFKEVAKRLSRTSAACGFRWNASIRKQYSHAIQFAKQTKKNRGGSNDWIGNDPYQKEDKDPLDTAILLLKKMQGNTLPADSMPTKEAERTILQLEEKNKQLKGKLLRYEEAWQEMLKLWEWVQTSNHK